MIIKTRDFGEIHYEEKDVIKFVRGIYGFESHHDYLIIKDEPDDDIMFIQSVEKEDLSFVAIDPYAILDGYAPELPEEDLNLLGASDNHELKFLVIAILSEDVRETVANLKSPIVICPDKKQALQSIAQNDDYPVRYKVFDSHKGGKN